MSDNDEAIEIEREDLKDMVLTALTENWAEYASLPDEENENIADKISAFIECLHERQEAPVGSETAKAVAKVRQSISDCCEAFSDFIESLED